MSLVEAIRLTEILLGLALFQQSVEHIKAEWNIFLPRLFLAVLLIIGFHTAWVAVLLLFSGLAALHIFQGPYNGGADRMSLLILSSLCLVYFLPSQRWQEIVIGYLALQLVLSYFISGWVKIKNPNWRSGRALCDVFQFSAYPVSESLRGWSQSPQLLLVMSWGVMLFELLFPFSLLSTTSLAIALLVAACFHLVNACLFGLNRFFWVWIAAYPSIIWFQLRIFSTI